jgi:hypothetical protein
MPSVRTVAAQRYVAPLREGGSLPAIMEADDLGTYVVKFRGAGQGAKALVAELLAGELGRALDLRVPELVLVELDVTLARSEPDDEIRDLLKASGGINLGLDYLPGSVAFDPSVFAVDPELAARIVWFDALITNVDRTPRNPNLLVWHKQLWLIDHGAALYFHHDWAVGLERSRSPFAAIAEHVLLPVAGDLAAADRSLAPRVTPALLEEICALIPDLWLSGDPRVSPSEARRGYVSYLMRRLEGPRPFLEAALHAQAQL